MEDRQWCWEPEKEDQNIDIPLNHGEEFEEPSIRAIRLLSDAYQRCSIAVFEHIGYDKAEKDPKWTAAM